MPDADLRSGVQNVVQIDVALYGDGVGRRMKRIAVFIKVSAARMTVQSLLEHYRYRAVYDGFR